VSHIPGDPEQLTIVSLDELLEGGNISTPDRVHESQIIVWRAVRPAIPFSRVE
jgi:hypothetical protein